MEERGEITALLRMASKGSRSDLEQLIARVYDQLYRIASHRMSREYHRTLQATELLSEAYIRVFRVQRNWRNRSEFFGAVRRAMRECLVDRARRRNAAKRGGGSDPLRLEDCTPQASTPPPDDVVAMQEEIERLDAALEKLGTLHPRQRRVFDLRILDSLGVEETAECLGISRTTATVDFRFARAFLVEEVFPHGR